MFLILVSLPIIDILFHKLCWKINKYLFCDLYIPKDDAIKIKEFFYDR